MLNFIAIMGRLTRDPELRRTGSGIAVASFTVAVDRDYSGKEEKETDFIDCVAWRQTGEFVSKYFTKGSMIVVTGRLQIRNWTDKEGNKRRNAEILADNCYFGDSKKQGGNNQGGGYAPQGGNYGAPSAGTYAPQSGGQSAPASGYNYGAPAGNNYNVPASGAPAGGVPAGSPSTYPAANAYPDYGPNYGVIEGDDAQLPF